MDFVLGWLWSGQCEGSARGVRIGASGYCDDSWRSEEWFGIVQMWMESL